MSRRGRLAAPSSVVTASIVALGLAAGGWPIPSQSVLANQRDTGAGRSGAANGAVTSIIGAAGGMLALRDGASVVVPAGAFRSPTSVSLREVVPPSDFQLPTSSARVGGIYAVESKGPLDLPVTVTLPYDPTLFPSGFEEGSVAIYQLRSNGRLSMVGSETGDPDRESSGQVVDIVRHVVTIRVRMLFTYTLLALRY
jgi:hypothetical protein